ncbi:MAG: LysM peptidoglycan-binding domain-containing protein [Bacillus sp. (in: firmicutes)]
MTEHGRKDQAENLRGKMEAQREQTGEASFPSRKEVHGKKKQKMVWKIKFPLVKLLALFFVLLPITIYAFYTYFTKDAQPVSTEESPSNFSDEIKIEEQYDDQAAPKADDADKKENTKADSDNKSADQAVDEEQESGEVAAETKKQETVASETKEEQVDNSKPTKGDAVTAEKKEPAANENKVVAKPVEQTPVKQPEQETPKVIEHVVQPQETIFRIAMKYYSSQAGIDIIKRENGLSSNEIMVGQVLRIPLN